MEAFNVMNLIKCSYEVLPKDNPDTYVMRPKPLKGTLFVSFDNLGFLSGQVRVRGKGKGEYPFHYLEMIDHVEEEIIYLEAYPLKSLVVA